MNVNRKTAATIVMALLGIVVAAGVTWGTSQLVRQRIGLASEPLTAGQRLLPPSLTHTTPVRRRKAAAKPTKTVTTTVPAPVTPVPTVVSPPAEPEPAPTVTSAPKESSSSSRDEGQRESSDSKRSAGRDD